MEEPAKRLPTSRCGRVGKCVAHSPHSLRAFCHTPRVSLTNHVLLTPSWKFFAKYFYPITTRYFSGENLVFINWGYEEDPPMALPLEASDEPDRYFIQLYHRTATQVDLSGKRVLEVSCGHGGGASHLVRTLGPASYTGLDFDRAGVEFCRKRHNLPGLDFVHGKAQNLPFPDQAFDAVINVEASHCYPSFPRFLAEVARVLRPGGHFLYADWRRRDRISNWEGELRDAPMRLMSERVISAQVARALEKNLRQWQEVSRKQSGVLRRYVHPKFSHGLQNGQTSYRMYCFINE